MKSLLHSLPKRKIPNFAAFQKLDAELGYPHRAFKTIHVGGTNGKGSVSWKIAESLRLAGKKVGLYTSPHISNLRERIQINGKMIPETAFLKHLARVYKEGYSFFDIMTALAFLYFKEEKVDWAVIEVGLGGRFDPTNVIHPEIAVITSIGYDHMEVLGDTLEQIAFQKGGIAKPGIPLVVGPSARAFFPDAIHVLESCGFYDEENNFIAKRALQKLGIKTFSSIRPKCRFEIIGNVILDAAHNVDGFEKLSQALQIHFPGEKFHFITHFSEDKQAEKCLEIIRPISEKNSRRRVICGSFYHMDEARRLFSI